MIRRALSRRRSGRERERGAAAIEFLGVIPVLLLAAVFALQLGVAGWAVSAAGEAARAGARAYTLDANPRVAAERALPGRLVQGASFDQAHPGDGFSYTARIRIPSLIPGLTLPEVTRTAHLPNIR